MKKILDQERSNQYIIDYAREIAGRRCPQDPNDRDFSICRIINIFNFVKNNLRYEYDPLDIEHVTYPSKLLQKIEEGHKTGKSIAAGDCDDHALLIAILLMSVGIQARWKIISYQNDTDFEHIFAQGYDMQRNRWYSLDAIFKDFKVGQEVKKYKNSKIIDLGILES
jgi:hypothetical protein